MPDYETFLADLKLGEIFAPMRWEGKEQSGNVEDRRSAGGRGMVLKGGIGTLVVAVVVLLMGGDPSQVLDMATQGGGQSSSYVSPPEEEKTVAFVRTILASTENVWEEEFRTMNKEYRRPGLVIFTSAVTSDCGSASAGMGPFYCPADMKIYIDLSFFNELSQKFGAPGDSAQAYVIAHEVGHHVQKLLGTSDRVNSARGRVSKSEENDLSVRLELQADFLAGMWARKAQEKNNWLEEGDIEEALGAANAIGDDKLQQQSQGRVRPDLFTHGTSEQRVRWFKKGFESGDIRQGDTFSVRDL